MIALGVFLCTGAHAQYRPPVTVLKDHVTVRVARDGSAVEIREYARRIETPRGADRYGEARISYTDSMASVEVLEAWTETPDGRRLDVAPDQIRTVSDRSEGERSFGDGKHRVIIFPEVSQGSVQHYRVRFVEHTQPFTGHYYYYQHVSPHFRIEDLRVRIEYPETMNLRFQARGFRQVADGSASTAQGNLVREYRYSQSEALPPEGGRVDLVDFAPILLVTTFSSYAELGRAYHSRAEERAQLTGDIKAHAEMITKGLTSELEKVRTIYQWVSRNIRYVNAHVGVGGWIPRPATDILKTRWGDCKDHVTLLEALLRGVGVVSSPALINSGEAYSLPELPVSSPFNHVITYVPSLKLFLDSTAEFVPAGSLPFSVAGKPALITGTGEVLHTPASSAERDRSVTKTMMEVLSDGRISGRSRSEMQGIQEIESRAAQANYRDREASAVASYLLSRFQETGSGTISAPDPADLSARWVVTAEFELDPVVNVPGPSAMSVPVGLAPGDIRDMLTDKPAPRRHFPATCASVDLVEETEIVFPTAVKIERLPASVTHRTQGLTYASQYQRSGQKVTIRRELLIQRARATCDAREDQAWREFLPVLQRDLRGQIFFK